MIKIANFSKNINFALCGNFRSLYSKSKLSKKIFAISVPVFISAFCVLPRHDLESLIRRAFKCFYGKKGFVDPAIPAERFFRGEIKIDFVNFGQIFRLKGRPCLYSEKNSAHQGCSIAFTRFFQKFLIPEHSPNPQVLQLSIT